MTITTMDRDENGVLDLSLPKESDQRETSAHYVDRDEVGTTSCSITNVEEAPLPKGNISHTSLAPDGSRELGEITSFREMGDISAYELHDAKAKHNEDVDSPIQKTLLGVTVSLHDEALWRSFAKYGTEMIINRGGRRMFPHIVLSMCGLDLETLYSVTLQIMPADECRYKFINNNWIAVDLADPGPEVQSVLHPDSPNTGRFWMQNRCSFSKVRLTNNKESSYKESADVNILLLSMHKYKVVIKIRPERRHSVEKERIFIFDESAFVAVTAYQNSHITRLKIQNNPFAKAFRDAHNTPFSLQNPTSPKKRDVHVRNKTKTETGATGSNNISLCQESARQPKAAVNLELPWPLAMASYRTAIDMESSGLMARMPYFPWASMNGPMQAQLWMKNSHTLLNAMTSFLPAARFMHPPVEDPHSLGSNPAKRPRLHPGRDRVETTKECPSSASNGRVLAYDMTGTQYD